MKHIGVMHSHQINTAVPVLANSRKTRTRTRDRYMIHSSRQITESQANQHLPTAEGEKKREESTKKWRSSPFAAVVRPRPSQWCGGCPLLRTEKRTCKTRGTLRPPWNPGRTTAAVPSTAYTWQKQHIQIIRCKKNKKWKLGLMHFLYEWRPGWPTAAAPFSCVKKKSWKKIMKKKRCDECTWKLVFWRTCTSHLALTRT